MGENQTTNRAVSDVVFDFCGVLIDWQCHAALDGVYPEQLVADICADNDPDGFFHYEDLMDGGADFADVLELVRAEQGDEIAEVYRYYIEHYGDALPQLVDGAEELLTELCEQGVHVWGLTNWSADTFHFAFEKYPQLQRLLSGTVVSGIEKLRKPNADIYELAQSRFNLEPQTTVFFDDTQRNVDGAKSVGWHAFRFSDVAQARRDLLSLEH